MSPEDMDALPHWQCKGCGWRTEEFHPACKCGCWSFTYNNVAFLSWLANELEAIGR